MNEIIDIIRRNPWAALGDFIALLLMFAMFYGLLLISPALEQTIIEAKGGVHESQ